MKQVISVRDLEEMVRNREDIRALPADAILTPSARDFLRDVEDNGRARMLATAPKENSSVDGKLQPPPKPLSSRSSKAELEAFFNSPYCQSLKAQICDV